MFGAFLCPFFGSVFTHSLFCMLFRSWESKYTLCYGLGRAIRDIQNDFFTQEQSRNHFMEVTDMRFEDNKEEFVKVDENVNVLSCQAFTITIARHRNVIVNDKMLSYLIETEMEFNANRRTKSNHVVALPEDETAAKMGAVVKSEEEKYFTVTEDEIKQVLDIHSLLIPCQRRGLYLCFKTTLHTKQLEKMGG